MKRFVIPLQITSLLWAVCHCEQLEASSIVYRISMVYVKALVKNGTRWRETAFCRSLVQRISRQSRKFSSLSSQVPIFSDPLMTSTRATMPERIVPATPSDFTLLESCNVPVAR